MFGWYVLSKILETFDAQMLNYLGGVVSGHTLKHLAAAIAGFMVCSMLLHRTLKEAETSREPSGNVFSANTERVAESVPPPR